MNRTGRVLCSAAMLTAAVFVAAPVQSVAQEAATTATAQGGGRGDRQRGGGGGQIFRIASELTGLTAEQKEKITKLQTEYQDKLKAARAASAGGENKGPGGWNNEEMQKLRTESKTQLEAILTDEQKKELEEKLKAGGQGMGRRGDRGDRETSAPAKQ
jgi:Spy/CpxP family protein refolding chaperone